MKFTFTDRAITGLLTVVPQHIVSFEDEIPNYAHSVQSSLKLQKLFGLKTHRYLPDDRLTGSDLAVEGIKYLFKEGIIQPEEVDGLLYVTQTPDYFIPPTSNVIQGILGLKQDMICLDINQGCAGFIVGLLEAFLLLGTPSIGKVLLVNADTPSKQTNNRDRNTFPLVGDAVSIAIVERVPESTAWMSLLMDGSRWKALHIPAGAYRMRSSEETRELQDMGDGNLRSLEQIHMDGPAIYNFTTTEVPQLIRDTVSYWGGSMDEVDYFMFHQPNKFILERLATILGVPPNKMPNDTSTIYGNTSSVSIPQTICHTLGDQLLDSEYTMCLAGFGTGLTWSAMVTRIGRLKICRIIESPC